MTMTAAEIHPALTVQRVTKNFRINKKEIRAVNDVSFSVNSGEICALLGPSGCGKSTVLRMVAGLEYRGSGSITLNGREITEPGPDRGMIFQSYTSFPWLTVKQNVEFGLRVTGQLNALREGVAEYFIERVGLSRFRNAYPDQLSGGMRQRVALARVLANGPELLLMDEPFGALDPETRWQMQELLYEVACREKMTVLMVTHDIEEALYLADSIAVFSAAPGRVRDIIHPGLKEPSGFVAKEYVLNLPRYRLLFQQLRKMMLQERFS